MQPPVIPAFTMGNNIRPDFIRGTQGIANALAAYQNRNLNAERLAQQQQQFQSQNALAQARLGMSERQMAEQQRQFGMNYDLRKQEMGQNADLNALRLKQLELGIEQARAQGARAAQLFPLELEKNRLAVEVARSNASQKDAQTQMLQGLGLIPGQSQSGPQQGGAQLLPQSFEGGNDPMLIPTQTAAPQADSSPRAIIQGMTPAQKAQFGLSMIGKGDAAKVLGDAAEREVIDKKTRQEIEAKEFAATETLANLQAIKQQFKPEYQTYPYKFKMSLAALREKLSSDPNSISPEERRQLEDYSQYRVSAFQAMNAYIKAITGAQMSEAEAKRIRKGIPDPGDEMLSGDSPSELRSKLDRVMKDTKLALARYSYAKTTGRPWQSIPLESMRAIIQRRGDQLMQEMSSKNIPREQLAPMIRQRLKQEFGGAI